MRGGEAPSVRCCLGTLPMHGGTGRRPHQAAGDGSIDGDDGDRGNVGGGGGGGAAQHCFDVELPRRNGVALKPHWNTAACDLHSGPWRCYLLLLSESAAMEEDHILFPNKIVYAGRTLFNATPSHTLKFLADPCLSEVCSPCWLVRFLFPRGAFANLINGARVLLGLPAVAVQCETHHVG